MKFDAVVDCNKVQIRFNEEPSGITYSQFFIGKCLLETTLNRFNECSKSIQTVINMVRGQYPENSRPRKILEKALLISHSLLPNAALFSILFSKLLVFTEVIVKLALAIITSPLLLFGIKTSMGLLQSSIQNSILVFNLKNDLTSFLEKPMNCAEL
jgi:hypothetical protein